jgi:hypothetical protein
MTDANARLEALLRADLPPTPDPLFRIAVLERRERQRFWRQLGASLTVDAVAGLRSLVSTPLARIVHRVSRTFAG